MEDLFPAQILNAIGGAENMERLERVPEVPDYAPNIGHMRSSYDKNGKKIPAIHVPPKDPVIKRGLDEKGRPFLEVFVPGYRPLIYYTYSNCEKTADFTDLRNWEIGAYDATCSASLVGSSSDFKENALSLLSQIMQGQDCKEARGKTFRF
jgi:hypothetical protein